VQQKKEPNRRGVGRACSKSDAIGRWLEPDESALICWLSPLVEPMRSGAKLDNIVGALMSSDIVVGIKNPPCLHEEFARVAQISRWPTTNCLRGRRVPSVV